MRHMTLPVLVAALLVLAGCTASNPASSGVNGGNGGDAGSIGLAAGGAQDVNDFRNNVEAGYVPQPASLTTEGLYHDYYFDTGLTEPCEQLFCPSYSRAVTRDPLSGETERYLTVGLNSGLSKADFERKALNLVVVLDTSSSMRDEFDQYYYDDPGNGAGNGDDAGGEGERERERVSKMTAAKRAVASLTTHLNDDDRFGLVTYSSDAETVVRMRRVGEHDMEGVRDRIGGLRAAGGTNLDAGMRTAAAMVRPYENPDAAERETRVIYVTDAMPNRGDTGGDSLRSRLRSKADDGVYSTFIGVGVDFNARFVETVNAVRGANHYTVRSSAEFDDRMDEGFEQMVTPLVFDLSLAVESDAFEIDAVYGSPNAEPASSELMAVHTLFPSRTKDGKTEGGVVLVQLERTGEDVPPDAPVTLRASYETRTGERRTVERTVRFDDVTAPAYDSSGVRKAVVLSRYADLMRNWMAFERAQTGGRDAEEPAAGIEHRALGQWEQTSVRLQVSEVYRERIGAFLPYFEAEAAALGDDDLQRELAVLRALGGSDADGGPGDEDADAERPDGSTDRSSGASATTANDERAAIGSARGVGS